MNMQLSAHSPPPPRQLDSQSLVPLKGTFWNPTEKLLSLKTQGKVFQRHRFQEGLITDECIWLNIVPFSKCSALDLCHFSSLDMVHCRNCVWNFCKKQVAENSNSWVQTKFSSWLLLDANVSVCMFCLKSQRRNRQSLLYFGCFIDNKTRQQKHTKGTKLFPCELIKWISKYKLYERLSLQTLQMTGWCTGSILQPCRTQRWSSLPHSTSCLISTHIPNPGFVNVSRAQHVAPRPSSILRPSACYFAPSLLSQRSDLGQRGRFWATWPSTPTGEGCGRWKTWPRSLRKHETGVSCWCQLKWT